MSALDFLCRQREFRNNLHNKRKRLHRVAYTWCQDKVLADDLVQEALTKGFKGLRTLRNVKAMDTWLFDILKNCWRDHLRRARKMEDIDDHLDIEPLILDDESERRQTIKKVRNAVYRLPLGQREVMSLVDMEGFSYAEVAEILEIPVGTVTSRISRARESLRKMLYELETIDKNNVVHIRRAK